MWYTRGNRKLTLRLAHPLVQRIVTASPESYLLRGKRISVVGHGVDLNRFSPSEDGQGKAADGRVVVSVGRLSPDKDVMTLVNAADMIKQRPGFEDVVFKVAGEEVPWSREYRAKMMARIAERGLTDHFLLVDGVPHWDIVKFYQSGSIAVSTSLTGSIDKVPLEAMGCGLPTLVTGMQYAPLLEEQGSLLLFREGDAVDLADKLADVLSMTPEARNALGATLRARAQEHSLDSFMDKLVAVFEETIAER